MKDKLNHHGRNVTSQNGEDGIIAYILDHIDCPRLCVEFGAWDGKHLSNTYSLWHDQGWRGILIEGDAPRCCALASDFASHDITVFNAYITATGEGSLDDLFRRHDLPSAIGVLSIDIDSYDYHVWRHLSYVDPSVVVIEHNETIPGYIEYHDPPGETFLRCSAKALEKLGSAKGYRLVACTVTNSIFIKEELFDDRYFPDMPVEYLFDYSHCTVPVLASYDEFNPNLCPVFGRPPRAGYRWLNRTKGLVELAWRRIIQRDGQVRYAPPSKAMANWMRRKGLGT